ncbi:MAG: DUF1018 domain-containing protein [Rhodobacteraceae bacterium]|nr:DUF1018 domain-containing protein [Paracoccaceae bacterium]
MAHAFAKIHVAAKQLGMDEDAQRDVYERVTGERSLRAMNGLQLAAVNTEMVRLGFKPSHAKGNKLSGTYGPMMRALWLSAYNLGVVRNSRDEAMIKWVYRQTQIEHLNWVRHPEDANKAIDALKLWMRRESKCPKLYTQNWQQLWQRCNPKVQVIFCQWDILMRADWFDGPMSLHAYLGVSKNWAMKNHDDESLIEIMNELGTMVRAIK